ncbi:MAG: Rieske (2Fe-2S) protein, partial [Chloroflexi bacterium]|nr:Rieske (2Fe-2S) protein [Chloroflexota bacterium]
ATRIDGKVCVVRNQCAHLPVPLDGGKLADGAVVCPLHNSKFDMCTGANLDWTPGFAGVRAPAWSRRLIAMGREPQSLASYTVIENEDGVFVEL